MSHVRPKWQADKQTKRLCFDFSRCCLADSEAVMSGSIDWNPSGLIDRCSISQLNCLIVTAFAVLGGAAAPLVESQIAAADIPLTYPHYVLIGIGFGVAYVGIITWFLGLQNKSRLPLLEEELGFAMLIAACNRGRVSTVGVSQRPTL